MSISATLPLVPDQPASRYRYLVAGFCFLLGLVNYLDRAVISYAIAPIEKDFGISDASFGLLMSAFAIGTLSVNGIAGFLLDRFGVKTLWSIGLFSWSVIMALQGLVEAFWMFLALRVLLGIGEGVNFPAMNRALVDWMRPGELGKAVSISLLGVPLALLLSGFVLAPLILDIGWRWSFICLGAMGGLLGLVFVFMYREPEERKHHHLRKAAVKAGPSFRHILFNPTLLATGWSFFAFGWVLFFGLSWLPGYLEQTWHMNLKTVGLFSPLPWALSILLMPLAGWFSDRLMRRTGSIRIARVHMIWICQLIAVGCFLPLIFLDSVVSSVIFVSIAIGFSMAPNSPYYAICADLFPTRTGIATGIIVTFFSLSGIACPFITGLLAQLLGGFGGAITALCVVVGTAVVGLLFFATGHGPETPDALTGDTVSPGRKP